MLSEDSSRGSPSKAVEFAPSLSKVEPVYHCLRKSSLDEGKKEQSFIRSNGPFLDSFLTNEHMSALKKSNIGNLLSIRKKDGFLSHTGTSVAGEPLWTLTDDDVDDT
jgi:hypothetical protein